MKSLIFGLFFLAVPVSAQTITNVHEVALSTETRIQTINLCDTSGAANVTSLTSSGTLKGAWGIEVYNVAAATVTINCGFDNNLSTNVYSAQYGREVPKGVGMYWGVQVGRVLRCMTQNAAGCTRVTITQLK